MIPASRLRCLEGLHRSYLAWFAATAAGWGPPGIYIGPTSRNQLLVFLFCISPVCIYFSSRLFDTLGPTSSGWDGRTQYIKRCTWRQASLGAQVSRKVFWGDDRQQYERGSTRSKEHEMAVSRLGRTEDNVDEDEMIERDREVLN